jgi:DNA repair exonuclease SbcCD ATPase subunit
MSKVVSIREEVVASLDDRIADAFEAGISSEALKALLAEVEQANADARAQSETAAARALDPKVRPAEVAEARRQMEDANFRSNRMHAAAEQLKGLLSQALSREAADRAAAEYTAAKSERDQLAKDLATYDEHAAAIVSLLDRLSRNNDRIKKANAGRSAIDWLYSAEMIARGSEREFGVHNDSTLPALLPGVKLPLFRKGGGIHGYAWPPAY